MSRRTTFPRRGIGLTLCFYSAFQQSNDLLQHLPSSAFIAIDEEMTGISIPGAGRPAKEQPPSQRYPVLKQAAERYSIIQWGICLFEPIQSSPNESSPIFEWNVRRYSFFMFPEDPGYNSNRNPSYYDAREVSLSPGAIKFLSKNGMDFDKWLKEGVSYQTESQAAETIKRFCEVQRRERERQETTHSTVQETVRRRIELKKREDLQFFAQTMAALREWLDSALPDEMEAADDDEDNTNRIMTSRSFLLPKCNGFMRRALYESIGKEYPTLDLESAGPDFPDQIRLWRLSDAERAERKQRLREESWCSMIQKVGMWRIFDAISRTCRGEELDKSSILFASGYNAVDWESNGGMQDVVEKKRALGRRVPVVVHNGFMDICFLLTHFHGKNLPSTLSACKRTIRQYFPVIYDTKILSTECYTNWEGHDDTRNLEGLYDRVVKQGGYHSLFRVEGETGNEVEQAHQAGYDAMITGEVYVRLCNCIREDQEEVGLAFDHTVGTLTHQLSDSDEPRKMYGLNRLYQYSLFTMDLENPDTDPLSRGMLADSTYRVSGIDPSVTTRDIVRCLTDLVDAEHRPINFEIVWIDDTTFLVATVCRPPSNGENDEEGEISVGRPSNDELTSILVEQGDVVKHALRGRFKEEDISSLADCLHSKKDETKSIFLRILQWFTGTNRGLYDSEEPERKRRRLN